MFSSTQMYSYYPNTFESSFFNKNGLNNLTCAFAFPMHSKLRFFPQKMTLRTSNGHSCTQSTQIESSSIHTTFVPSNVQNMHSTISNKILFNSNHRNALKCTQLLSTTSNQFFLLKCARLHSTTSNQIFWSWNELNTFKFAPHVHFKCSNLIQDSEHQPMSQMCSNTPLIRNTPKTPPSSKTFQDSILTK